MPATTASLAPAPASSPTAAKSTVSGWLYLLDDVSEDGIYSFTDTGEVGKLGQVHGQGHCGKIETWVEKKAGGFVLDAVLHAHEMHSTLWNI